VTSGLAIRKLPAPIAEASNSIIFFMDHKPQLFIGGEEYQS
jgi:hypothetical protein